MNNSGMILVYIFFALLIGLSFHVRAKKVSHLTDEELKDRANQIHYTGLILGAMLVGLAILTFICIGSP